MAENLPTPEQRITAILHNTGKEAVCRGCNAKVYWIRHNNGKWVPYTKAGLNHFIDCPKAEKFRRSK